MNLSDLTCKTAIGWHGISGLKFYWPSDLQSAQLAAIQGLFRPSCPYQLAFNRKSRLQKNTSRKVHLSPPITKLCIERSVEFSVFSRQVEYQNFSLGEWKLVFSCYALYGKLHETISEHIYLLCKRLQLEERDGVRCKQVKKRVERLAQVAIWHFCC